MLGLHLNRIRDARPRGDLEQAADLLTKLNGNLAQLRRGIQEIGTPRDGPAVRSRLRSVREQSSAALQEVMVCLFFSSVSLHEKDDHATEAKTTC